MSKNWDKRMMQVAKLAASWSKDRSVGVGCVIASPDHAMLSSGFNGFPRGVNDNVEERHQRPAKYKFTEHAERNAIYNAARHGIKLEGATIYLPWYPCADCARAIVQSGIKTMVATAPNLEDPRWGEDFKASVTILAEGNVTHEIWEEESE
jgi:dCMP deaminase